MLFYGNPGDNLVKYKIKIKVLDDSSNTEIELEVIYSYVDNKLFLLDKVINRSSNKLLNSKQQRMLIDYMKGHHKQFDDKEEITVIFSGFVKNKIA